MKDPRLVTGLTAAINTIVPAGKRITAKARDRDLFNIYKLYLVPVGGDNKLGLGGPVTAPAAKAR
jgi:hypothetical protein